MTRSGLGDICCTHAGCTRTPNEGEWASWLERQPGGSLAKVVGLEGWTCPAHRTPADELAAARERLARAQRTRDRLARDLREAEERVRMLAGEIEEAVEQVQAEDEGAE